MRSNLVRVRETAHTRHNAENVVVRRIDVDIRRRLLEIRRAVVTIGRLIGVDRRDIRVERGRRERQVKNRVINAREVARAAGLEVLRLEGERIDVDARRRRRRVVLEGLDEVEVAALTLRETVLAVELDLGDRDGVAELRVRVAPRAVERRIAVKIGGVLDDPDKLLAGVVERELDLVRRRRDRLRARELELLNQVLVRDLREAAALLRIEVDVVNVERARGKAEVADPREDALDRNRRRGRGSSDRLDVAEVLELVELDVDLDLVVLEGNQREREARVAIEPELKRDVERALRDAALNAGRHRISRGRLLDNRGVGERAVITRRDNTGVHAREDRRIGSGDLRSAGRAVAAGVKKDTTIAVHHVEVRELLARGERELIPDVEPLTVVLVDLLATDLNVDVVDHVLAEVRDPRERGAVRDLLVNRGERDLNVDTRNKITVAADRALDTLAEVADTVKRLLNRLHREVRVAAVELLEERNLRVRRQVDVLCTIGDELHKTTRCHCL